MAVNIVEIIVKAKDMTKEGFAEADAQSSALGEKIKAIGAIAAGGLAVVGYEAAKMAISFDAQMTMLNTQAGVSKSSLAGLKSGVLALAGQVGFSPDSLAESLYHVASNMASMGASSGKMLDVVKVAAEGARTGGADLVDVTNALTAAVASGIPGVQNYQQAMGMLNATVGAGDMKMQDLADAFGSGMVATVKGFGLSLKDVGAALATFGDNNIRGAHAGTQLRMSVMALASPTKYGMGLLQQWGEHSDQLARDMRNGGLMKALTDLQEHFRKTGVSAKEQGEVITNMFGKKAGAGLNVLMDQLDRLKSKYPAITKGAHGFGQAWTTTQGTMKQQLAELQGGFDALMITLGQKLLPVIQVVVSWMLKHKQVVVDLLIAVGALAAGLAVLSVVLTAISVLSSPFALIVVGIAALVAGVIYAYTHFKAFRDVVADVGRFFVSVWHGAMEAAGAVIRWFVSGPLAWIRQQLAVLSAFWKQHSQEIEQVTRFVWAAISLDVKIALMVIKAAITPFLETIKIIWSVTWVTVRDVARTAWDLIGQLIHMALQYITGVIGIALDLITGHWSKAWHDLLSLTGNMLHDLTGLIRTAVSGFGSLLYDAGKALIGGLVHGIEASLGSVTSAIGGIAHEITSHLPFSPAKKGPLSGAGDPRLAGLRIAKYLAQGMSDGLPAVSAAAGRMAGGALPGGYGPSGGGGPAVVFAPAGGSGLEAVLWNWFRQEVRVKGGSGPFSVQKALGNTWPAGV